MRSFVLSVFILLGATACSRNELTREKAAELIGPKVVAVLTLAVPNGEWNRFGDSDYVKALADRGIVRVFKEQRRFSSILQGTREVDMATPTDVAKPFLIERPRAFVRGTSPALVMANARLREITGVKAMDERSNNAEVEFTWNWAPTPVGIQLDGLTLRRLGMAPITIEVRRFFYPAKASCSVFDDGWRCEIPGWSTDRHLNDTM